MPESSWRKRLAIIRSRLYLYPAPEPLERSTWFWVATALVTAMAAVFSIFYIIYLTHMQDAFQTPGEDVGIMDQAVWSVTHGHLFHQTICNIVSDTNCYTPDGFSRFAIHFEPVLFPLALLYVIWPGAKILMVMQTLIVALGAFPAFWLARLRLRSNLAGAALAALYLLYPELQQAEAGYFHAVVLTSSLLMFTLYFLYTRRTAWLFVFAILSMACKEEIPLVIAMLGLWSLVFQQRWRSGLVLIGMAAVWLGLALLVFRAFSPTGHPLLSSRYAYLGSNVFEVVRTVVTHPWEMMRDHILEHAHLFYIRLLFSPVNYISLLAPWVLVLAVPSLAINLFSSDPNMYQGTAQYNAEIVPILIFATIEALVVLIWLVQWLANRIQAEFAQEAAAKAARAAKASEVTEAAGGAGVTGNAGPRTPRLPQPGPRQPAGGRWLQPAALLLILAVTLVGMVRHDRSYGVMPYSQDFLWPQITPHTQMAQHFINMIPAAASVSAQSSLVPHLSERESIYLFPYATHAPQALADYVFLDVTSDPYPYAPVDYRNEVRALLLSGNYGIQASGDGYLLLKHGLPGPGLSPVSPATSGENALPNLDEAFCSFTRVNPASDTTPVQVDFTPQGSGAGTLSLVGFQINRPGAFLQVITYWKVSQGMIPPLHVQASLLNAQDQRVFMTDNFAGSYWCPSSTWQVGTIVQMRTDPLYIGDVPRGLSHLTLSLLPYSATSGTISSSTQGVALHIVQAPATVTVLQGKNLLQLQTFTL